VKAWRITKTAHAPNPLSGEGGVRAAGRWNSIGTRMAYASTSRPLAVLEMLVHLDLDTEPSDYLLFPIDIPDELVEHLHPLPGSWNAHPPQELARAAGDRWIQSNSSPALLVPSAVLSREHNFLINPAHPEFRRLKVHIPEANFLDPRLFQPELR
jgi:RES domain-containing protein